MKTPTAMEEFKLWIEQLFDEVFTGPPKSSFTIDNKLHRYQTIALGCVGELPELLAEFKSRFLTWSHNIRSQDGRKLSIVWRAYPEIDVQVLPVCEELFMRYEDWVDNGQPDLPAGVGQTWDTKDFWYILGFQQYTYVYMRFSALGIPLTGLPEKPEGFRIQVFNEELP